MANPAKWRKFTRQEIEECAKESRSYLELSQKLGYNTKSGSAFYTIKNMIAELGLDVSHFLGKGWNKKNFDYKRFRKGNAIKSSDAINALVNIRGHCCESCGLSTWLGRKIPLEVHHIDGDHLNNDMDNLLLLCPNCHSFTSNYRGKNNNGGSAKVSDGELIEVLKNSSNIGQALKSVGLTARGGNYQRARNLIYSNNITHLV